MPGKEAITYRMQRGALDADSGMDTAMLDPDVLRVGQLPAAVTVGQSWNYADVTYLGQNRTAFQLHLEANGGAWQRAADDRRYYHFANSVGYASGNVILRLTMPAAPGALTNGRVNEKPVAWAAASSAWTATAGQYEYRAPLADNPLPTIGEFVVEFTTAVAQDVWYPQGQTAQAPFFSGKDAHILSAFDTEGYTDIPNAMAQRGFTTGANLPDISDLNGVSYGTTRTWSGGGADTYHAGFRVPIARKGEIRSFHAKVGATVTTAISILGDDGGFTYGYVSFHGYQSGQAVSIQALGKVSIDTARLDVSGWNAALGSYSSGTLAALPSDAPAGSVGRVYGDIGGRNGIYHRLNTGWEKVADTTVVAADKAALDALASPAGTLAVVPDAAARGIYLRVANAWVEVGSVTVSERAGLDQTAVDARIRAYTGQATATAAFAFGRLPDATQRVSAAFKRGGLRYVSDGSIQIAGDFQGSALADIDANADWGYTIQRSSPARPDADPWIQIRFRDAEYPVLPTPDAISDIRLSPNLTGDADDPEIRVPIQTIESRAAPAGGAGYKYAFAQLDAPAWPFDPEVNLRRVTSAVIDALPEDGTLTTAIPRWTTPPVTGDVVSIGEDGAWSHAPPAGMREVYSGTTGLAIVNLQHDVGPVAFALSIPVDLDTERHGTLHWFTTATFAGATVPVTLGFDNDGGKRRDIVGERSLDQIAARAVYNGTDNRGEDVWVFELIVGATDTVIGTVTARISRTAANVLAGNYSYTASTGHAVAGSGNLQLASRIYVRDSGLQLPASGRVALAVVDEDTLPDASAYPDETLAFIVSGGNAGSWVNGRTVTHGTGAGLGGQTLDPTYDMTPATVGQRTVRYIARNAWNFGGQQLAAHGDFAGWPAALERIYTNFRTRDNSDGEVVYVFNSAQAYAGAEAINIGTLYAWQLARQTATQWRIGDLGARDRSHLLSGVWRLSEPDAAGSSTVAAWERIVTPPQTVELLDWQPANGPALTARVIYEVPAAQALAPALDASHDDWMLQMAVQLASAASAEGRIWSMTEEIPVSDWRAAANSPDDAHFGNCGPAWQGGVFLSDNIASSTSWARFVFTKGINGRVAIINSLDSSTYLRRLRVRRRRG